jgi:hypothetical protein
VQLQALDSVNGTYFRAMCKVHYGLEPSFSDRRRVLDEDALVEASKRRPAAIT